MSRTLTLISFNIGAHALVPTDQPSNIVTITTDSINAFDGKISIREALKYLEYNYDQIPDIKARVVGFADEIFTNKQAIIELDPYYGELFISNHFAGQNIQIDGTLKANTGNMYTTGRNVILKRTTDDNPATIDDYRILRAGNEADNTHDWNITLNNLTLDNGNVLANDQNGHGGALYIHGASVALTLTDINLANNDAASNGTIYAYAHTGDINIILENVTIANNDANIGAAIYADAHAGNVNISAIDTTIAGNIATTNAGGIYSHAAGTNNLLSINSILFGNYAGTEGDDIVLDGTTNTVKMAYSIYGTVKDATSNDIALTVNDHAHQLDTTQENVERIFATVKEDNGRYVPQISANDYDNYTVVINVDGEAAFRGTFVGKVDDTYYYFESTSPYQGIGVWRDIDNTSTRAFSTTANTNYGLNAFNGTNKKVFTEGANFYENFANSNAHVSRLEGNFIAYIIGAHALVKEAPSSFVTYTEKYLINPYDFKITLRDALIYTVTTTGTTAGQYDITFKDDLFANDTCTINLNNYEYAPYYGSLKFHPGLATKSVKINGGVNVLVLIEKLLFNPMIQMQNIES